MKKHELKAWPQYFEPIWEGKKTFEIRINDRNYQEGDTLILREYLIDSNSYTGRVITAQIGFVMKDFFGLAPVFCAMSLQNVIKKDQNRAKQKT